MSTRIIKINRGDTLKLNIYIPTWQPESSEKYYLLRDGDKPDVLYFALLYPNSRFEDAIICRGYDKGDQAGSFDKTAVEINLSHSDTKKLAPGIYYYTAKLMRGGRVQPDTGEYQDPAEVRTIVERTKFIVCD